MKQYRVLFSQQAQADLSEIYYYIIDRYNDQYNAKKLLDAIIDRCNDLEYFPRISPAKVISNGYNFRFIHTRRYTIAYYIDENLSRVIIRRILAPGRNAIEIISSE
ncbi:type II toxin-antitoxin system RelE/ParE family toxin [Candidatus Saccharibacteria bacterium]|nr:type II toxin-antitoxin system RelE/ParE family toxin [Candidatus Saccharibacteria bacterium]